MAFRESRITCHLGVCSVQAASISGAAKTAEQVLEILAQAQNNFLLLVQHHAMIIRQLAVRHGRSVWTSSGQSWRRTFASEISNAGSDQQASKKDGQRSKRVSAHPSEPSDILDSSSLPPTAASRDVAQSVADLMQGVSNLQSDLNAHIAASQGGVIQPALSHALDEKAEIPTPYDSYSAFQDAQLEKQRLSETGSHIKSFYHPDHLLSNPPYPSQLTLPMLLANQTHLGHATSLWNPANSSYIFGIREGIHIISLDTTLAYLRRAVKVVREVARRGGIIVFVGTRKGQQKIVTYAAKLSGGYHIFDRWVPGTLTNGQQILGSCPVKVVNKQDQELSKYRQMLFNANHSVLRPDLVVCLNPVENEVCLHECGLYNVPTIGVIDTDANPSWVTYPIPANDDSLRSIALLAGVLGRAGQEGQKLRKEAVENGGSTFSTTRVQQYLEGLEEIASMDVRDRGPKERSKDT